MTKYCSVCNKKFHLFERKFYHWQNESEICEQCSDNHELETWRSKSLSELIELLGNTNVKIRRKAANFLGEFRDKRAVAPLIEALKDQDYYVIYNAINSLGNIGDPRALKELRKWAKKKNVRPEVNQIAMESVNKLKQIKFQGMAQIVSSDLRNISWQDFEDRICELLNAVSSERRTSDMGIDGVTSSGIPMQIKQSESVGRPVVDKFCHAIERYYNELGLNTDKRGIIVAFSFTTDAYTEVDRAKREEKIDINLVTVDELLNK